MKHISKLLILVLIALLVCPGCSSTTQKEKTSSEISVDVTGTTEPKEVSNAETLMRTLQEYTETHECGFIVKEDSFECDAFDSYSQYKFLVTDTDDSMRFLSIYFWDFEDEAKEKSFEVYINTSTDGQLLKKFIIAYLKMTNPSLDEDTCTSKMQEFVNSYSTDNLSDYLDNGDNVLVMAPTDDGHAYLYVNYKDELPLIPENTEDYHELDYTSALSELNNGEYVDFEATISEITFEAYYEGYLKCKTADGNTIYISYTPIDRIEPFVEGKTYEFYGVTGSPKYDMPYIILHGAEEVE